MGATNPQAEALNQLLRQANPNVLAMLAERGKQIFFPHKGILGQGAEAKGKKINATIGIALEDDGSPLRLQCLQKLIQLPPDQAFNYAPSFGVPELRDVWKTMIYQKNPTLGKTPISRPVVTCALTHALSMCGYLFADPGDVILTTDLYWDNYQLIYENSFGAKLETYPTFVNGGYNIAGLRAKLLAGQPGKRIVLLNFPNNPAGYTVTEREAQELARVLIEAAEAGNQMIVLVDDAYFGLVFEQGVYLESMFALLANAHPRLLAVKIDGATKEDYVWGFRVGFITYGIQGATPELFKALEDKTAGAVRANISNAPNHSQALLRAAYTAPEYEAQKQEKFATLKRRCETVKQILASHPEYAASFTPVPFNSGYFMCVRLNGADPETVRQVLLKDYSTGVIAISGVLRVAFSATPTRLLDELFANLHQAVQKVKAAAQP
jgi:aspartate/methionine/tyrosine aminotransferase